MLRAILASFTYRPVQRWGPVSPHGVGTALGFLAGAMLMARRAEPRGIPRAEVYNAVTWGAVGALIGARGFYVIGHLSQFNDVGDMFAVWQGGLTMFGGFVGGLLLGLAYLKRKGFDIVAAVDAAAPGFAIGVIIGRIGDIIIADHLGRATNFFLGYRIPDARLAPGYGPPVYTPGSVVHHTAVYDLIGTLVLFLFLFWVERRDPPKGTLFATFSLWYGLQRFLIDFTRNRTLIESHYFGLSGSQWAGLAFAVVGALWLMRLRGRPRGVREPEPAPVPVPVAEETGGELPPLPTREEAFAAEPGPTPERPPIPALDPVAQAEGVPETPPTPPTPPTPETPPTPPTPETPPTPPTPRTTPGPGTPRTPPTPPTPPTPETPPTPPTPETPPTPPTKPTPPAEPLPDPEHPEAVTFDETAQPPDKPRTEGSDPRD